MKSALLGLIAAATLSTSSARADDAAVAVIARAGPSPETAITTRLLSRELGRPVRDGDVATAGLEVTWDLSPELLIFPLDDIACGADGCRPRLLTLTRDGYVDLFAGLSLAPDVGPEQFLVSPSYRGSYYDLIVGGTTLVNPGTGYVDAATLAPSQLETGRFVEICTRADITRTQLEGYGQDATATAPELCRCMAEGFEARQQTQSVLDDYSTYLTGEATDELYDSDSTLQTASDVGLEIQQSCLGVKGWNDPITPERDAYPDGYQALRLDGLMDACVGQPWVTGNRGIRTADRALAFCGCLTGSLISEGAGQPALDALAGFYRDDISETELTPAFPLLLDQHDTISQSCINAMSHTTADAGN